MSDHRQITWGKRAAPYVTTALAVEAVALFGFAYFTDSHIPGISPMAATSIFIDGTKDILPTDDSQAADRMRNAAGGAYDQCPTMNTCSGNVYINYPRDFGILTGGVGYDESRGIATEEIVKAVKQARHDQLTDADPANDNDPIYVVGYSQGANAQSDAIQQLQAEGVDTRNVTFVMLGNGARNDGGLWARLPAGVYVPFLGLDFGASTNPVTPSNDPNAPKVLLITKQYDGAADWPRYVLINPLAAVNAAMGFMYVHNGYYQDVDMDQVNADLDTNQNGTIDPAEVTANNANPNSKYIVTQNGNVTDIVIKNQPGDLPITEPLKALGVPEDFIKAIDPLLRAMIEAGYERPTDGVYPSEPVHFKIFPKPDKLFGDFLAIAAGADQTGENLEDLAEGESIQPFADPGVGNSLMAARVVDPGPAAAAPPAPPGPSAKPQWPTFAPQQWISQATQWQAPPTPPPVAVEEPEEQVEQIEPAGNEVIIDPNSLGNTAATSSTGSTRKTTAGAGLQKLVNGVYDATLGRIIPRPTTAPVSTAPDPVSDPDPAPNNDPDPGSDPGTDAGGDPPS